MKKVFWGIITFNFIFWGLFANSKYQNIKAATSDCVLFSSATMGNVCPMGKTTSCQLALQDWCCPTLTDCNNLISNNPDATPVDGAAFIGAQHVNPLCTDNKSINTAIGCIPVSNTNDFMGWILGWAIGIGGGIAFLLIVYASFMTMTSQGNPERLKAGQELLTSAISGLILLIFSVFILKFIGVDILKLKDFGFGQ